MRVLMLDFDGVLHPAQDIGVAAFAYAPRLGAVLAGQACDIVISSTWRDSHPIASLRALLPADLAARVVDVLGPDGPGPHVRYHNILRWVGRQGRAVDWRALDDVASDFPAGCPQLIHCDGRVGLTGRECRLLGAWLHAAAPRAGRA